MKRITVSIDSELNDWLEGHAKSLRRGKSSSVRDALIAYRKYLKANSVTARAGNLVGKFNSGVTDLATNKKYMKGFGRS